MFHMIKVSYLKRQNKLGLESLLFKLWPFTNKIIIIIMDIFTIQLKIITNNTNFIKKNMPSFCEIGKPKFEFY